MKYTFPLNFRRQLHRRAYKKQQDGHYEVAGVFLFKNDKIELVYCKNHSEEPYHFAISTTEFKKIKKEAKVQGKKFGGIFHSHPVSEAYPGKVDLQNTNSNELMMIYDVCDREAKLWRIVKRKKLKKANLVQSFNTGFHN